ncbi:PAP2 family protein [Actinomadura craniellae]|uniref:PAP2 family protein n=1 Tax=Actinomadura craniellae TaxID=2231787 RepID=A0A365H2I7_9ACTN|nr:PAP2 family protein [Actinomadura craniellae]
MRREILLIAAFYIAYSLIRVAINRMGTSSAFGHAHQILALERSVGIDVELGLNQALLGMPWLARGANLFYATAHFAVTLALLVWVHRHRPAHYRWLRTALMAATALALLGFWLYPLAPPRFLSGEGYVDPVVVLHSVGLYSSDASGALANQYAAMPSMHAGWALWCGLVLVLLAGRRWVKVLGALYPVVTVLVILSTANHYVLDAAAGFALVGLALIGAFLLYRKKAVIPNTPGRIVTDSASSPSVHPLHV